MIIFKIIMIIISIIIFFIEGLAIFSRRNRPNRFNHEIEISQRGPKTSLIPPQNCEASRSLVRWEGVHPKCNIVTFIFTNLRNPS